MNERVTADDLHVRQEPDADVLPVALGDARPGEREDREL